MVRKNHRETTPEGVAAKADAEKADEPTASQVQDAISTETEQGFRGVQVDPTPNENYTAAGVTSGAPTPETDEQLRREATDAVRGVGTVV